MRKLEKINKYLWFQEGPGVRKEQYRTEGIKLLNVSNLVNGEIDLSNSDRYVSVEEGTGKYAHFLCDVGDLIIASSGIKVEYFDKKMGFIESNHLPLCMNTSTIRFKSISKDVNLRYFMYYLKSEHFKKQLAFNITGSAQLNFGPSHLNKMEFYLYNLEKQLEIIKILDEINNLISYKKKEIEKLDNLIKSQFIEMFDCIQTNRYKYEIAQLGKYMNVISDFNSNGGYEKLDTNVKMLDEPDYAWIVRTTDLESGNISDRKYVNQATYEMLSKSTLFGNELIMCKIGSAGKIYLMPITNKPATLARNAFLMRFDEEIINMIYLYNMLSTLECKKDIESRVRGAVTKTITKDETRKISILVPPKPLQDQFAAIVEQIDKSKYILQKQIDALQELLDSKMEEFFG